MKMKYKHKHLWDAVKAMFTDKCTALTAYVIKEERSNINILSIYLVKVKVLVTQLCPSLWDPIRLLCLWNSPGKNTIVDSHFFSRGSSQPKD